MARLITDSRAFFAVGIQPSTGRSSILGTEMYESAMHCSSLSRASWHASAKTFASFRLNFPGRLDENLRNGNFISVTRVPAIVSQELRNLEQENSPAQTKVIRVEFADQKGGVAVVSPGLY